MTETQLCHQRDRVGWIGEESNVRGDGNVSYQLVMDARYQTDTQTEIGCTTSSTLTTPLNAHHSTQRSPLTITTLH